MASGLLEMGVAPRVRWTALVFLLVATLAIALAFAGVAVPPFVIAVWLVCFGLLAAVALVEPADRPAVAMIVGGAIAMRLTLGAILLTYFRDEAFRVFDDTQRYLQIGGQIADGWRAGSPPDLFEIYRLTVAGYYYIVAVLRYIVGPDELAIIAFNSALAAITAGMVYRLASRLGAHGRERILAVAIASFAPSVVFWSALPLKDTPITFLLVAGVVISLELVGRQRVLALLALLATLVLMFGRLYATLFIALAAAIVIVLEGAWRRQRLWSLTTAALDHCRANLDVPKSCWAPSGTCCYRPG